MPFDAKSGKEAGKISKRGTALPVELRNSLNELVNEIVNDLDYQSLNNTQKIKLLDIALKYSLPRLSIEKSILTRVDIKNKRPITQISDLLNQKHIKLFSSNHLRDNYENFRVVLKISGIWETEDTYGLTFKFIDLTNLDNV